MSLKPKRTEMNFYPPSQVSSSNKISKKKKWWRLLLLAQVLSKVLKNYII